jgi:hypothetical protein
LTRRGLRMMASWSNHWRRSRWRRRIARWW